MRSITEVETNLVKPYIDAKDIAVEKNIAPVENGTTSIGSYAIGEQFIRNNVLYKAKTAITAGDTLTLDTNYEAADDVTTQVSSLKQDLADTNNALDDEVSARAILGAHNLSPNTGVSGELFGVTFTVNSDKSVSTSGSSTATGANPKSVFQVYLGDLTLDVGKDYILSGCPTGGGDGTYEIMLTFNDSSAALLTKFCYGDDVEFTVPSGAISQRLYIRCKNGVDVTGLTFRPMIRLATDTNSDYQPYAMTNQQLTEEVTNIESKLFSGMMSNERNLLWHQKDLLITSSQRQLYQPFFIIGQDGIIGSIMNNNGNTPKKQFFSDGHTVTITAESTRVMRINLNPLPYNTSLSVYSNDDFELEQVTPS